MKEIKENKSYHVKLFRLYEPSPILQWEGLCNFHIQRRPNGDIGVLTPKPDEIPISWAEYCLEDMHEELNGHIHCQAEDYLMIIT